ncbi:hypothetical protein P8452_49530 [Trifolium repens]|nr:hypothetical protein P8452_49530 [Trifolium repens]
MHERTFDFCQNCKVIGHHVENCKRWNKEEEVKANHDNTIKKKPTTDPKPHFVPVRDGRAQQGTSKEVINVETDVINVDNNIDNALQPTPLEKEIDSRDMISKTPPDKAQTQLTEKEITDENDLNPKAILLAQDLQLEKELNKHLEPILTPVTPISSFQCSTVKDTQAHSGSKSNSSISASLVKTPDRDEEDQIEDTEKNEGSHESGFQVVLSKSQKNNQRKKKQAGGSTYGTRSRVAQKPFK